MKIVQCLLDINNEAPAGNATLSSCILGQNKEHLWEERQGQVVDTIVLHYISAMHIDPRRPFDLSLILRIFCDCGVSSHYLIDRTGTIFRLVPEDKKAWHAGGSVMPAPDSRTMANGFSIGIELVATPDSGFTQEQYSSCALLCRDIEQRHRRTFAYVGHQDIAGEAAVRLGLRKDVKLDPGPLFNWVVFRRMVSDPSLGDDGG